MFDFFYKNVKIKSFHGGYKMLKDTKIKIQSSWQEFKEQGKICIEELKNKNTRKKQIPNLLTASRLLSPFFIIPTAISGNLVLTVAFTSMFALTDAFDGYFARKFNATSEFGRMLDPITDKLFAASLLIPLTISNPLILINLFLESIIALINTHSHINNNHPKTLKIGKIKTWALFGTIALQYMDFIVKIPLYIINSLFGLTTLLQILSIKEYGKNLENYKQAQNPIKPEDINDKAANDISKKEKTTNKELIISLKNLKASIMTPKKSNVKEKAKQYKIKK